MTQNAIVYARVSTTRQADHDLSIPDQIAHAERYCAERGFDIVAKFVDSGASARDDNRPEFQRMVGDVKSGVVKADILLVHSFSRFFRESYGSAFYNRLFAKHGVQVISMTQDTGEGAQGELMRQVLSSFDEYNSAETAKHVTRSMLENAKRGFWNGSRPPFGFRTYVAERAGAKEKKKLEIDPGQAEIVKLIFQLYVYGDGKSGPLGIKNTVSYLSAQGLTMGNGMSFRLQTVQLILRRTAYIGLHYFNRRDSRTKNPRPREEWIALEVPRIVEDDLFYAAQAQLEARNPKITPPGISNSIILLTGIARCEHCGSGMKIRTGKGGQYRYYACSRHADMGKTACPGTTIPVAKLDEIVTDSLCDKILQPDRIKEMIGTLTARNSRRREKLQLEQRELNRKRREVQGKISNMVDAMEQGALGPVRALQERFAKRQNEYDGLTRLISRKEREIDLPTSEVTPKRIKVFTEALRAHLRDVEHPQFRRAYMRLLLDKVVVGKGSIRISGPKAALAQQLQTDKPVPLSMVPTLMDGWCTRQESNL